MKYEIHYPAKYPTPAQILDLILDVEEHGGAFAESVRCVHNRKVPPGQLMCVAEWQAPPSGTPQPRW